MTPGENRIRRDAFNHMQQGFSQGHLELVFSSPAKSADQTALRNEYLTKMEDHLMDFLRKRPNPSIRPLKPSEKAKMLRAREKTGVKKVKIGFVPTDFSKN